MIPARVKAINRAERLLGSAFRGKIGDPENAKLEPTETEAKEYAKVIIDVLPDLLAESRRRYVAYRKAREEYEEIGQQRDFLFSALEEFSQPGRVK